MKLESLFSECSSHQSLSPPPSLTCHSLYPHPHLSLPPPSPSPVIPSTHRYRAAYLKDYYNFLQVSAIILPFTIIPFRAATTWCASTGVGYCALPEGNSTDINQACIAASHVQWIFASLAYLVNALLIIEFLALFRYVMGGVCVGGCVRGVH